MSTLRVGLLQHDVAWRDPSATLAALEPMVATAADAGARLVLATEMFAVGVSNATEHIAEPTGGPTTTWLRDQADRHQVWVGGSVPERDPGQERPTNSFVLAGPDGTVVRYRKRRLFSYAGEDQHYQAGTTAVRLEVDGVRITPFVCYDLRFAPDWWDQATSTDLYVVVASWPARRAAHWDLLLHARAVENQAYVAGVNRIGRGGGLDHDGGSKLVDPWGRVVADAPAGRSAVVVGDVDTELVAEVRAKLPVLADRDV